MSFTIVPIYATAEDDPRFARSRDLLLSLTGDMQFIAHELCQRYGITRQRSYEVRLAA